MQVLSTAIYPLPNGGGFGYRILADGVVSINQDCMPGVPGFVLMTHEQAQAQAAAEVERRTPAPEPEPTPSPEEAPVA